MVAEGMTTTIETAHSTLHAAVGLAARYGLEIGADGTISGPPPRNRTETEEMGPYHAQVQELIGQAVERVTAADKLAAAEFAKLPTRQAAADIPVGQDQPGSGSGGTV